MPDIDGLEPTSAVPAASAQLTVSDRWVIFARKRNDNFLLKDIENLQKSVEESKENLPGPAKTLVCGPEDNGPIIWQPLPGNMGGTAGQAGAEEPESPLGDLFFPKPYNNEQVDIVRRLEKADGVVVQGPPGTGKTHTISNIICHYLATGRRVLVVSHGEAALSVLRDKLPEEVRDLSISITTSEREGLKQLEGAIRLLQSIVQTLRPGDQSRKIRDVESEIIGMRKRIAAIDVEVENAARMQLSEVKGRDVLPAQLAKAVVASREACNWFTDRPRSFLSETSIQPSDLDELRRARLSLGARLEHLHAVLPAVAELPSSAALAQFHIDIVRADEHAASAGSDPTFTPRITSLEGVATAERAAEALDTLVDITRHFDGYPWLRSFVVAETSPQNAALAPALEALLEDGISILEKYQAFVQQPVVVPDAALQSLEFAAILSKLAEGQSAFGIFAFSERKLKPVVEDVRVLGRKPQSTQEWGHVRAFVQWRGRVSELNTRWNVIAADLGLDTAQPLSLRQLSGLTAALQATLVMAPQTRQHLDHCLQQILAKATGALWPDAERMGRLRDCLRNAAAATRLSASRAEVARVVALFGERGGKIGTLAKNFLTEAVGRAGVHPDRVEAAWHSVLSAVDDVAQHRSDLNCVLDITARLEREGVPAWAERLKRDSALHGSDPAIPANWMEAWDWAASERYLGHIDQREAIRALADERASLDEAVAKSFERLVRERTFYALAQNMTGPVRSALMMFATALRRIGGGTGAGAARHRRAARCKIACNIDPLRGRFASNSDPL